MCIQLKSMPVTCDMLTRDSERLAFKMHTSFKRNIFNNYKYDVCIHLNLLWLKSMPVTCDMLTRDSERLAFKMHTSFKRNIYSKD
jgi:hypothetical protein